jgi:TetR/AcrR family transcriptional regulator, transcriptional repressor for nem operon
MLKYKKSQHTKQLILAKADQLFSENGYQATGVDEITSSIGMTSGVFYNHFKSKSDLLSDIIQNKINRSNELLLVVREKESAFTWVKRALQIYLSREHRDSKTNSCPLTTLSTEIVQLDLQQKTGLMQYTQSFAEIMQRRLLILSPENKSKAHAIMSMCVGAVQLSRLEKDDMKSMQILNETYQACLQLITQRTS